MPIRVFILPMIETLFNGELYRGPKYVGGKGQPAPLTGLESIAFREIIDYGFEPVCIMITDMTAAQITILSAQPDVLTLPVNLDNNLTGAAVTTTKNFLEGLNIPANWVTSSFTYRQVLRLVGWLFQFMQRLYGLHPIKLFGSGITLSTQFQQLEQSMQEALIATAQSFGINTDQLQPTTTLRQILKGMADFFNANPLAMNLVTF